MDAQKKLKAILLQREIKRREVELTLMQSADRDSQEYRTHWLYHEKTQQCTQNTPDIDAFTDDKLLDWGNGHIKSLSSKSIKDTNLDGDSITPSHSSNPPPPISELQLIESQSSEKLMKLQEAQTKYSDQALTVDEFLNQPFDEMMKNIQHQLPLRLFHSTKSHSNTLLLDDRDGLICSTDHDGADLEENHELEEDDEIKVIESEEYSILDFINRFDPEKQRERIILANTSKKSKKVKMKISSAQSYPRPQTAPAISKLEPVSQPNQNHNNLRNVSAHQKVDHNLTYSLSYINTEQFVGCVSNCTKTDDKNLTCTLQPTVPKENTSFHNRGRPHRPYIATGTEDEPVIIPPIQYSCIPIPPLSPPFPPSGPRDPRQLSQSQCFVESTIEENYGEFNSAGVGIPDHNTKLHSSASYAGMVLPYTPQSLHSVLSLPSRTDNLSSNREVSSFSYRKQWQPQSCKLRPSSLGLDDFFNHTFEEPSPSPQYYENLLVRKSGKSRGDDANSRHHARRDSFDSLNNRSATCNGAKKYTGAINVDGNNGDEGINPIPSPKKKRPPPNYLPFSQPPRATSTGKTRSKSTETSKETKKERIAAIYMKK